MKRKICLCTLAAFCLLSAGCTPTVPTEENTAPPTKADPSISASPEQVPSFTGRLTADCAELYVAELERMEAQYADFSCDLIDLDGDETPELVIGAEGDWVSVYTCDGTALYTLMDCWSYGAGGNHGYDYLPGENRIRNYNTDFAGLVLYEWYGTESESHEIVPYYDGTLQIRRFRDLNGNGVPDANEPVEDAAFYYYGEQEITETEYAQYRIAPEGNWRMIQGKIPGTGLKKQLEEIGTRQA